jgi:hypothetical protein
MDALSKLLPVVGLVIVITANAVWFWRNRTQIPVVVRDFTVVTLVGLALVALQPFAPTNEATVVWAFGIVCVVVGLAAKIITTEEGIKLPEKLWFFMERNRDLVARGNQNGFYFESTVVAFGLIIACHFLSWLL